MTAERMREEVQVIVRSGLMGRSRTYVRLLEYLLERTAAGSVPKEVEIASDVFGKGADFDPSQDSLVRVYAHNLRRKLEHFYSTAGVDAVQRLELPRGEYRLVLTNAPVPPTPGVTPSAARLFGRGGWGLAMVAAVVIAAVSFALGSVGSQRPSAAARAAAQPLWAPLLDDALPTLVVLGDYYIFAELDARGEVERLVRDFAINSSEELDDLFRRRPELADSYLNLDLTYLPRGSAFALRDLLRVLYTSDKSVRVVSMSELNAADLRSNHIVYIGFISALDTLLEFVFASSGLVLGPSYDELVSKNDGRHFTSGAGLQPTDRRHYRDYGLLSSFPGPAGNQFVILAGTRDTGLMHTAYAATEPGQLELIEQELAAAGHPPAYELLYEVTGIDRTNLDAMLVYSGPLDYQQIWGGELMRVALPR